METNSIVTFFSFISVGAAILQIILFFKLWIMTSDVKSIKSKINHKGVTRKAQIAFLKGNKDEARELLHTAIFISLLESAEESGDDINEFNQYLIKISLTYKPICEKMGLDMIDLEKYRNKENLPI